MPGSRTFVSTDMVEEKFRDEFWTTVSSAVYDTSLVEDQPEKVLRGSVSTQLVGRLTVGQTTFNAQRYERTRTKIVGSELDSYVLQLFTSGSFAGDLGGASVSARPGDICISDLMREEKSVSSAGSSLLVTVPRDLIAPQIKSKLHGAVLNAEAPTTHILTDFLKSLNSLNAPINPSATDQIEGALSSLIAASISTNQDVGRLGALAFNTPLRDRIYNIIENNLTNAELGPEMLMQRLNVSRAHLYRAVADDDGISTLIRNRRLDASYEALKSARFAEHSIEEICFFFGFSSGSQFLRSFKARFGVTPSSVRAAPKSDPDNVRRTGILHEHIKQFAK